MYLSYIFVIIPVKTNKSDFTVAVITENYTVEVETHSATFK